MLRLLPKVGYRLGDKTKAGKRNRTNISSLEDWRSTVELYPHTFYHNKKGGCRNRNSRL